MVDFKKALEKSIEKQRAKEQAKADAAETKKDAKAFRELVFNASRKNALLGPIEDIITCTCGYVLYFKDAKYGDKKICPNCIKTIMYDGIPY